MIGLDHNPSAISTDSARGPERTGNNRHQPDEQRTRQSRPAYQRTGPPPGYTIGISAGQPYRTSSPVTARPTIIRWISNVASKIVKVLAVRAVYAGQRPVHPVVSARIQHALSEMHVDFGSASVRVSVVVRTHAREGPRPSRTGDLRRTGHAARAAAGQDRPRVSQTGGGPARCHPSWPPSIWAATATNRFLNHVCAASAVRLGCHHRYSVMSGTG
jgi:hypothetical protein